MENKTPIRLKTTTEFLKLWALPKSQHPLISVVDYRQINHSLLDFNQAVIMDFYSIII